jgi:diguanylate cyclase (GGDEF)-like protein/PAS domain S-box-containing protein
MHLGRRDICSGPNPGWGPADKPGRAAQGVPGLVVSSDGRIERFDGPCERLFAYQAAEVIGHSITLLIPGVRDFIETLAARHASAARDALAIAEAHALDALAVRSDGSECPVRISALPYAHAGVLSIVLLVTDASRAAAERDQSQRLLQAIEQTADLVLITDVKGFIEYVNPAFELHTGFRRSELAGQRPSMLRSGRHGRSFYAKLWRTILSGEVFRGVLVNRKRNGELFYEEKTITPIKDASGSITHFVSTARDVTERMEAERRLHSLANYDSLTGLPNRNLFSDRLAQALERAQRSGRLAGLLYIDLDRFKHVNDMFGHVAGDRLLEAVARRLCTLVRGEDTVARLSGDEFAVILHNIPTPEAAAHVAQKILDAFREPFEVEALSLQVAASLGLTLYPQDGGDPHTLLRNADIALHQAKLGGRAGLAHYTHDLGERVVNDLALEGALRRAINSDGFSLYYQPIVALGSGRAVAAEALLRWKAGGADLPTSRVIALAEETGLIVELGEWVMRTACRDAAAIRSVGHPVQIAVNVSARQFRHPGFLDMVWRTVSETGAALDSLVFEITESVLMDDVDHTRAKLAALADAGVRIALDDFGTGYSSLAYLKRLPIHIVKIDRSFIADSAQTEDAAAVVSAVVALARTLGLSCIAEGVEDPAQLALLQELGCDLAQGHLFSEAIPLAALEPLFGQSGREVAEEVE